MGLPLQVAAQVPEYCQKPDLRDACVKSCAAYCKEASFLRQNLDFCVDNDLLSGVAPETVSDDPQCQAGAELGATDESTVQMGEAAGANAAEGISGSGVKANDCSAIKKASERIRCERQGIRPDCSDSVVQLEDEAELLATQVQQNLLQYGDLLTRDLTDVSSRALLCEFSIDELDEKYLRATEDPAQLRTVQRTAREIQECQGQWEDYVRTRAANSQVSDQLSDDVARQMEAQFAPLKEQLENLSSSITQLNRASGQIEQLIGIHIDFCDPAGTQINSSGN